MQFYLIFSKTISNFPKILSSLKSKPFTYLMHPYSCSESSYHQPRLPLPLPLSLSLSLLLPEKVLIREKGARTKGATVVQQEKERRLGGGGGSASSPTTTDKERFDKSAHFNLSPKLDSFCLPPLPSDTRRLTSHHHHHCRRFCYYYLLLILIRQPTDPPDRETSSRKKNLTK